MQKHLLELEEEPTTPTLPVGFLNPANLITLLRIPFAAAMWWKPYRVRYVLTIIFLAGMSDVLDGWVARRLPKRHSSGIWLDPLCDKIFVLSTLCAVTHAQRPAKTVPLLIALREMTQFPLTLIYLSKVVHKRKPLKMNFESALLGKLATCIQFLAIGALLIRKQWVRPLSIMAGVTGLGATSFYLRRYLTTPSFKPDLKKQTGIV
jgi:phosphatidylglycerophosphate synthase